MAEQLTFSTFTFVTPNHKPRATLDERFAAFIDANPWVVGEFLRRTWVYKNAGKRVSAKMLIEVMRSEWLLTTNDDGSGFAIDNSFGSRLARLLVQTDPRLEGTFEMRVLRTEKVAA